MNLKSMPPEVLSLICDEVLAATYRADLSPIIRLAPATMGRIDHRLLDQNSLALPLPGGPLSFPRGPRPYWLPHDGRSAYAPTEEDWTRGQSQTPYTHELPSNRLSIIRTSSYVKEAALGSLRKQGTFLFVISGPDSAWAVDSMDFEAVKPMQKFLVHLNLLSSRGYSLRPSEGRLATEASTKLISNIAASASNKTSFVIRMCHCAHLERFRREIADYVLGPFAAAVVELTGFKTVVLRLIDENGLFLADVVGIPPLREWYARESGRTRTEPVTYSIYDRLDAMITSEFGPSERMTDGGGYHVLTYHPQSHLKRTKRSVIDSNGNSGNAGTSSVPKGA